MSAVPKPAIVMLAGLVSPMIRSYFLFLQEQIKGIIIIIYAALKAALKVLVELRQWLGEDAKLSFNMTEVKINIPCVSRERAPELVLWHIDQDPSLESLRELYEQDLA
jgi:hypothetical protein